MTKQRSVNYRMNIYILLWIASTGSHLFRDPTTCRVPPSSCQDSTRLWCTSRFVRVLTNMEFDVRFTSLQIFFGQNCWSALAPYSHKVQHEQRIIFRRKWEGPFFVRESEIIISPGTHRTCPWVLVMSFFRIVKSMAVHLLRLSNRDLESVAAMKGVRLIRSCQLFRFIL